MAEGNPIVLMKGICKAFPGVRALHNVDFEVRPGEVHALVGENGAGKSTLIKILTGAYTKDSGDIYIDGTKQEYTSPIQAKALGIGAVYQDVMLAPHLSVAENFFLGQLPLKSFGRVDWKRMRRETQDVLTQFHIKVEPMERITRLTPALQEMVTIAKVVYEQARVIIFDEPTALLTSEEVEQLYSIIDQLKARGIGIIYISHRLEEIFELSDRVTVLKDGEYVTTKNTADTDKEQLVEMMVGRKMDDIYNISHREPGEVLLEVEDLSDKTGRFENIGFQLRRGEILGFFGLVGSGRTEIMRCLYGADAVKSGAIRRLGEPVSIRSPRDAIRLGIGLLPEDRKKQGVAMLLPVKQNTNLASYDSILTRTLSINLKAEARRAIKYKDELNIKTPSINQQVRKLSGGNQQKVVLSKWLCKQSEIYIFDEPTVGVDVGAKMEIYKLFEDITAQGNSIILISSYLSEVIGLADRLITIYEGKMTAEVNRADFDEKEIIKYASGIKESAGGTGA